MSEERDAAEEAMLDCFGLLPPERVHLVRPASKEAIRKAQARREAADQPVDLIPRARLVAWLRERAADTASSELGKRPSLLQPQSVIRVIADAIERGEAP